MKMVRLHLFMANLKVLTLRPHFWSLVEPYLNKYESVSKLGTPKNWWFIIITPIKLVVLVVPPQTNTEPYLWSHWAVGPLGLTSLQLPLGAFSNGVSTCLGVPSLMVSTWLVKNHQLWVNELQHWVKNCLQLLYTAVDRWSHPNKNYPDNIFGMWTGDMGIDPLPSLRKTANNLSELLAESVLHDG